MTAIVVVLALLAFCAWLVRSAWNGAGAGAAIATAGCLAVAVPAFLAGSYLGLTEIGCEYDCEATALDSVAFAVSGLGFLLAAGIAVAATGRGRR